MNFEGFCGTGAAGARTPHLTQRKELAQTNFVVAHTFLINSTVISECVFVMSSKIASFSLFLQLHNIRCTEVQKDARAKKNVVVAPRFLISSSYFPVRLCVHRSGARVGILRLQAPLLRTECRNAQSVELSTSCRIY